MKVVCRCTPPRRIGMYLSQSFARAQRTSRTTLPVVGRPIELACKEALPAVLSHTAARLVACNSKPAIWKELDLTRIVMTHEAFVAPALDEGHALSAAADVKVQQALAAAAAKCAKEATAVQEKAAREAEKLAATATCAAIAAQNEDGRTSSSWQRQ